MNKIKATSIVALILIVLLSGLLSLAFLLNRTIKEKNRLNDNQTTLLTAAKYYKTSDSLNAAGVDRLTLKNSEFEKYNADLVKTVESLNLKVRRLQSVSQTGTETKYIIQTAIRDSLIYTSSIPDTIKCIKYADDWLKLSGCIQNKQFSGIVESKDTIVQAVHRVPRKFLFFKYGTKAIRQEVVSKNPNSRIAYTQYIEFKK